MFLVLVVLNAALQSIPPDVVAIILLLLLLLEEEEEVFLRNNIVLSSEFAKEFFICMTQPDRLLTNKERQRQSPIY